MAVYSVPPDISAKEKIVGGLLTASQLITMLAFVTIGVVFTFVLSVFIDLIAAGILAAIIFIPLAIIFAFKKVKDMPILKYLRLKQKHKRKKSVLLNHRVEAEGFEIKYAKKGGIL